MKYARTWLAVAALGSAFVATPAAADFIAGPNTALVAIRVTDGTEVAETQWILPLGRVISGREQWNMPGPNPMASRGKALGLLKNLEVDIDTDPAVSLNFVYENPGNSVVTLEAWSIPLTFPSMVNPAAFATAAFTLTDNNGDGAQLTGLLPGGKAYEAVYNSGTVWTGLVGSFSAGEYDSAISKERLPGTAPDREIIPATVNGIQSHYKFELSPYDQVSITSRFDIVEAPVPEPSSWLLLAVGSLCGPLAFWRRKQTG